MRRLLFVVLTLLGSGLPRLGADSALGLPTETPPLAASAANYSSMEFLDDNRKLGIGDRVSYRVIEDKEDPKPLLVTDSGELEIPYYGRIKATEKTCKSIAYEVKGKLEKELYVKATVILAVDLLNKKRGSVYLAGQVRSMGSQDIPSDEVFTLTKAILKAGGFGDFADRKRVRVTRQPPVGQTNVVVFVIDVEQIFEKGRTEKDLKLESGDLILIPSRAINF